MKTAPVTTTIEVLYPKTSAASLRRKDWYLDKTSIRPKKQFRWTMEERATLYNLRVEKEWSIPEIQKHFRRKNKIPIFLGIDDDNDKFSRTRLHNQIRIVRASFHGLCYKCRSPLSKRDLKRINKKEKEDPSQGLCLSCSKESSEYKKERRATALKIGICPICVKRKVLKGHTLCKKCLSASHRHRYIQGLCGKCGEKPLAKNSISLCDGCLTENRKASKAYRRKKRLETATTKKEGK
jgi:hypothetical protein